MSFLLSLNVCQKTSNQASSFLPAQKTTTTICGISKLISQNQQSEDSLKILNAPQPLEGKN